MGGLHPRPAPARRTAQPPLPPVGACLKVDERAVCFYTPCMRHVRLGLLLLSMLAAPAFADRLVIAHVPHRYVVVQGDTLWGIASHFFRDPWRWPGIWNRNHQIRNPDLIYPGDVIVLRFVHGYPVLVNTGPQAPVPGGQGTPPQGRPAPGTQTGAAASGPQTEILYPRVRSEAQPAPVPTIDPSAIAPFLRQPLVLSGEALRRLPYVEAAVHRYTFIGPFSKFYARNLGPHPAALYDVYQKGPVLAGAHGRRLGYETLYVGRARLVRPGKVAVLQLISAVREVHAGDHLIAWRRQPPIPYYYPRAPRHPLHGHVVASGHSRVNIGTYAMLALDIGRNRGMRRGYVLRIYAPARRLRDPVTGRTFKTPPRPIGLVMVFKTFPQVSYGIVMQAHQEVHVGDPVAGP